MRYRHARWRAPRRSRLFYATIAAALIGVGGAALAAFSWSYGERRPAPVAQARLRPIGPSRALVVRNEIPLPAVQGANSDPRRFSWPKAFQWGAVLLVMAVVGLASAWAYREHRVERETDLAIGGVAERAIPIMLANGCAGCHTISGVPGAQGQVGPRLDATLSTRLYLAGVLPNTRENMIRWLRSSREVVPHTVMPSTGISEQEARDVAAYLYAMR